MTKEQQDVQNEETQQTEPEVVAEGELETSAEQAEQAEQAENEKDQLIETLQSQLAAAERTVEEQKDSVIRAKAEVENVRRRATLDVEKAHKFALEKFSSELLPVADNLERALQAADSDNEQLKPLIEGIELTLKSFESTIAKFGMEIVSPEKGDALNPELHQAMSMIPDPEVEPNKIINCLQKGYTLNGRLLRPAMVMVAAGGGVDTKA
ncbi:nucleotide exchange factor GrpE [Gayadomonas joobiniege]|uniref:nucleotide exchange factor GrpE n=1 Tax=Gayadomonas joobiniege TaxID=1234606 RepID=UPI000381134E|nr:nucleotide exchange factor GrpE [Gayadomonas joobiniege]